MRPVPSPFERTLKELWTQLGLRPDTPRHEPATRLVADGISLTLLDRLPLGIAVEAEIVRLADEPPEQSRQLTAALEMNLGLLLDCRATIHRRATRDGTWLVARSFVPYTVNAFETLIRSIEDSISSADFAGKQLSRASHGGKDARPKPARTKMMLPL